jgi:hypothetical protein
MKLKSATVPLALENKWLLKLLAFDEEIYCLLSFMVWIEARFIAEKISKIIKPAGSIES